MRIRFDSYSPVAGDAWGADYGCDDRHHGAMLEGINCDGETVDECVADKHGQVSYSH